MIREILLILIAGNIGAAKNETGFTTISTAIEYKHCIVADARLGTKFNAFGEKIGGCTIIPSRKFPFNYYLNCNTPVTDYVKTKVGVGRIGDNVAVVTLNGEHTTKQSCSISDWSFKTKVGDNDITCYKLGTVPTGLVVGSPVLDQGSAELLGMIIDPVQGIVLPSDKLIRDIYENSASVEVIRISEPPKIRDGIWQDPPTSSWTLAEGTSRNAYGDWHRAFQLWQSRLGITVPIVVSFVANKYSVTVVTSLGHIITFDTIKEQKILDAEESRTFFTLGAVFIDENNLILEQGGLELDTINDFWVDRNRVRENIGTIRRLDTVTGDRKAVGKFVFPGTILKDDAGISIGGLGAFSTLSQRSLNWRVYLLPNQKVDRLDWIIPLKKEANLLKALQARCRLSGRGTSDDPYLMRGEGDLELVEFNLLDASVLKQVKISKLTKEHRPLSIQSTISGQTTLISIASDLYLLDLNSLSILHHLQLSGYSRIFASKDGFLIFNEGNLMLLNTASRLVTWRKSVGDVISGVMTDGDNLYFIADGYLNRLNAIDGSTIYRTLINKGIEASPLRIKDDIWLITQDLQLIRIKGAAGSMKRN